jgi:hypothetical protein
MTSTGYKMIIEKYQCTTNLKHDRKQLSNRIRQFKGMYMFIKDLHTDSGLGRDENGWPTASLQWWEDATKVVLCAIGLGINGIVQMLSNLRCQTFLQGHPD